MSRPNRDEIRRALDALGTSDVAAPDLTALDATEARLRSVHAHMAASPSAPTTTGARFAARRAIVGSALASALALGALLAFAMTRNDTTTTLALEVTAAEHAYIILPDGSRIPATAGVAVPNGARLVVDEDGSVTIDGVVIGPGETGTVIDGKVSIDDDASDPDGPNRTSDETPTNPSAVPTAPSGSDPGRDPDDTQDSTPRTTASSPTTTTAGNPTTTTAPPTTTTPPTTVAPAPTEITRLGGGTRVVDGQVRVRWDPYLGDDFAGYAVLARYDGGRPRPANPQTVILARIRGRDVAQFRTPFVAGMTIRVIAVDSDRTVVASTRVFAPTLEPRTDPTTTTTATTTTTPAATTTSATMPVLAQSTVAAPPTSRPPNRNP